MKDQKCENQETKAASRLVQWAWAALQERAWDEGAPGPPAGHPPAPGAGGGGGRQRMRWLDGISDSMDMSLS